MDNFTQNQPIMYHNGQWKEIDQIAPEEISIDLYVNGLFWLTFLCSPFQIKELAIGFLYNEHIISSFKDIANVWICKNNSTIDLWLHYSQEKPKEWRRTSGCHGGQTSLVKMNEQDIADGEMIYPEVILNKFEELLSLQEQYRKTRGIHCSIMSDGNELFLIAEDIGRHNTLDKLAGQYIMNQQNWKRKMILTTGRLSSEMLQKSAHIGASIVISRTSPTQASINTAVLLNITLIGYARRNQFIIYAHPEKIAKKSEIVSSLKQF